MADLKIGELWPFIVTHFNQTNVSQISYLTRETPRHICRLAHLTEFDDPTFPHEHFCP